MLSVKKTARRRSPGERTKMTENTKNNTGASIWTPEVLRFVEAEIHHQTRPVARRFHLADGEREELESHVRGAVLQALAAKYDDARARVRTFAARATRYSLLAWAARETRRRTIFHSLTDARAEYANNLPLPDSDGVRRQALADAVRCTVRALSPQSRRVCELYMKLGNLTAVRTALHKSARDFHGSVWPVCRMEFIEAWKRNGFSKDA